MTVTRILIVMFRRHTAGFHQVTVVTYKDYFVPALWLLVIRCITNLALRKRVLPIYSYTGVEIKTAKWEGRCVNGL